MRFTSRTLHTAVMSAALALAGASPALSAPQAAGGQQTQPAQTPPQGPLVLTPIESTFVVAPVAKVTKIAGVTSGLAGFYAGKVFEDKLTIGGSAFWLANPTDNTRMWYCGAVVGWTLKTTGPFSLRAQALVGAGEFSRVVNVADLIFPHAPFQHGSPGTSRVRFHDDFAIAEPELTLQVKVLDHLRLNVGAGYRATTHVFGFRDDLRGATASIGLEFGFRK
jgi:hypothetical protein